VAASYPADVVRHPVKGKYLPVRAAPGGRLSQGLAIEASILARLLGLRLLKLEAHITLVPANLASQSPASSAALSSPAGGLDDAVDLLARATQSVDQVSRDLPLPLRSIRS
jgi:hypothetical protein